MGGEIGDPKNGYRIRCKNEPTVIVTEKQLGDDGLRGSMALCPKCLEVLFKQLGPDFVTTQPVTTTKIKVK